MGKKLPLKFSLYCIPKSMWDMVRNIIELSKRHKNSHINYESFIFTWLQD